MPICEIYTNIAAGDIADDLEVKFSKLIAEQLGKPLERVTVSVHPHTRLVKNGSAEPCAKVVISSIGVFDDPTKNKQHSAVFLDFFNKELNIPDPRITMEFLTITADQIASRI